VIIDNLSQMFENELEHHPEARLLDFYKLFMQACLGPGHIIKDYESVKHYLIKEVENCHKYVSMFKRDSSPSYLCHLKDEHKKYCTNHIECPCLILKCDAFVPIARYSLQLIIDGIIPLDDYYQAFIKSFEETEYLSEDTLVDIWHTKALPMLKENVNITFFKEDLQYINELFSKKQYLVSHTDTYREKYKPSYRLINKNYMQEYEDRIKSCYFTSTPV